MQQNVYQKTNDSAVEILLQISLVLFLFQLLDLKMEAAFNLQLLYQQDKNPTMARYIMQKYLVIE